MKLNSVILADDTDYELFVLLKDATSHSLDNFANSCGDVELLSSIYMSDTITKHNLSEKMVVVNNNVFLCFWYGHGEEDSFKIGDEKIVTNTDNHYVFSNAMIYTFSCLNGGKLADTLIANGVRSFVGYADNASFPCGKDDLTCKTAMTFVSSLLGGKSINDAVEDLKTAYEDTMYNPDLEPFQAEIFQHDRDNLVLKGDGTLTIKDFLI